MLANKKMAQLIIILTSSHQEIHTYIEPGLQLQHTFAAYKFLAHGWQSAIFQIFGNQAPYLYAACFSSKSLFMFSLSS